ncbi:hypothetical protein NBRC116493_28830 [Aurantivibrio infirmus]
MPEADVVVTRLKALLAILAVSAIFHSNLSFSAVLPEDRVDVLYHAYDGGGADISGPSVLVRKSFADTISIYGNYYVDMVTSASIDVVFAGASTYTEERTEYSVGFDYLYDKTIMSLSYSNSSESDYDAETIGFGISQDFFGDLTNISLGFSYGSDIVGRNGTVNPVDGSNKVGEAEHRRYSLGISQIVTKNLLVALNFETVIDEGFLNNPYRSIRHLDPTTVDPNDTVLEPELYPETRNSDAFSIKALYYLPYRASIRGEYRTFGDSWGINADSLEFRYTHPIEAWNVILEGKLRFYKQNQADFYSDLFPFANGNGVEFRARDKEMSDFGTTTFGLGASYEIPPGIIPFFDKSSVNLYWDHIQLDYDNFLDATQTGVAPGSEDPYSFNANVIRLFFSFWY